MGMGYDGSIRIDTRVDSKGFNSGIKGIGSALKGLAVLVAGAFATGAIVNFGKSAVQAASDLSSAMVGLQSVLDGQGRSFSAAQQFIDSFTKDGLVPATNAIVAYKNLALRGYDDSQIQKVMTALKDSAAFGKAANMSMGEAVKSASEGLKNENSILVDNAGVTKNVAKMWDEYAKSIGTTSDKLTQQQKIQAEVNGILEESKYQAGDAAKISQTYAGQVAQLGSAMQAFKVAAGQGIIPILQKILPVIIQVIAWLTALAKTFGSVMSAIFGTQTTQAQQAASAQNDVATSTQAAADAQGNLAANTEQADKAAKGALASFDELNVLQKDTGAGEAAAGGAEPVPAPIVPEILPPNDASQANIEALREKVLGFLQPAIDAFGRLKEALQPLGQTIWEGLKWAYDNILVPFGKWVLAEAVPKFLDLLSAGAKILNGVLEALQPLGIWLWKEFLLPLGQWTGKILLDALDWLVEQLKAIGQWIQENPKLFETFVIILGSLAAAWWLVHAAIAAWVAIGGIAGAVTWVVTAATTAFGAAVAFLTSPITIVIVIIGALIAGIILLVRNWDWVKEKAGQAWDWIKDKWYAAGDWFKDSVTEPIKKWFTNGWDNVKTSSTNAWDKVKERWSNAGDWFKDHVTEPIKNGFNTALDWVSEKWQTIFNGITDFVRNAINTVIGLINGLMMAFVNGLNSVIGGLNSISFTVPDWVPLFGGQQWGLSIPYVIAPQIPYLATGAVIPPNSQFLAMLGDQRSGRNIEAPEGLIRQIIQEEIGKVQADIRIEFGGSLGALVRELKPRIDRENVRIGGSLIAGGATR